MKGGLHMSTLRMRGAVLTPISLVMAAMVAFGTFAAPAWAKKPPTFTCASLTGILDASFIDNNGSGTISGCTGNTGGTGTFASDSAFTTATITWANSDTTAFTLSSTPIKHGCDKGRGVVTADNTGSTAIGATVKLKYCVSSFVPEADAINSKGKIKL